MTYFQVVPGQEVESAHMNAAIAQGAIPFSDAAARAAAIPAPYKGQLTYLASTSRYETWTGSAWLSINATDDALWASLGLAGKKVQYGATAPTISGSGGATVPFPTAFGGIPIVLAIIGDENANYGLIQVVNSSVTASQFAVRVFNAAGAVWTSGGAIRINWIAIGTSATKAILDRESKPAPGGQE